MSEHKFKSGDMIFLKEGPVRMARVGGRCKIISTLPESQGTRQYRVRFDSESFERCVGEDDIDVNRSKASVLAANSKKENDPWLKASSVRTVK